MGISRFYDEEHLKLLGELMSELALPIADVVAIIAAFGSGHNEYLYHHGDDHGDFGSTDPTLAFETWAARVDFPAAWGGREAWRHFRGLKIKVGI